MTTSYQKISRFDRPHVSEMLSDSKISTLECGLKNFRICLRIRRMCVDDSRIRKEKVADSKIFGYVWTGPKSETQSWKNFWKFKQFTFLRIEADSNLSAPNVLCRSSIFRREFLSDFARYKITVDVGCAHMLSYNARVWRRLRALWSYNELGLTNHSVCLNVAIL